MSIQELSQKLIDDMRTILEGGTVEPVVEKVAGKDAVKKQIDQVNKKLKVIAAKLKKARAANDVKAGFTLSTQQVDLWRQRGDLEDKLSEDASNDKSDDGEGLDKVDKKAAKKKFKDRKDKDIDNDGDTDDSDEYLHKRRKAISKNVKQDEGKLPPALQKAIDAKKGKDDDDEDEDDVEEGTLPPALQKAIDKKKGKEDDSEDEDEDKEDQKEGKYLKYSDLLLKKQRMSDSADKSSINKEIKKERQKLGISEENLEDLLIHYLPEQEK